MDNGRADKKKAYIDSTSLYEVVIALSHNQCDDLYPWSADCARFVTVNLIQPTRFIVIPPTNYKPSTGRQGTYAALLDELQGHVTLGQMVDSQVKQVASTLVREWCQSNATVVAAQLKSTKRDRSYEQWLDKHVEICWVEHTTTLGGLFENDLISTFARVLNVSESELSEVRRRSARREVVEGYAKSASRQDEAYELTREAHALSVLLRGRYYGIVAKFEDVDLAYHPGREWFVSDLKEPETTRVDCGNTAALLTEVIVRAAFFEAISHRLSAWSDNVKKCRNAGPGLDLSPRDSWEEAVKVVIENVNRLDLRTYPRWKDHVADVAADWGRKYIAEVVGFFAAWKSGNPDIGSGAACATETALGYLSSKREITKRLVRAVENRSSRITELASYSAGGINPSLIVNR